MREHVFTLHASLEQRHWWFRGRRAIILPIIDRVSTARPWTIIDVGCGTGGTVEALSKRYRCIGIDSSEVAISTARALYRGAEFRCGVVPRDIQDLQAEAGLYLLMDVLEHIKNDREFLESIIWFARPGSTFLITVPARQALWSEHDITAGHFRRYEQEGLRLLWADLPVRERLFTPFNYRLYPLIRALRYLGQLVHRSWGGKGTDFSLPPEPLNELLTWIFAGECSTVLSCLDNTRQSYPYTGVSLVALLEKNA